MRGLAIRGKELDKRNERILSTMIKESNGVWRSLVARFAGGEEVVSSILAIPTTL